MKEQEKLHRMAPPMLFAFSSGASPLLSDFFFFLFQLSLAESTEG